MSAAPTKRFSGSKVDLFGDTVRKEQSPFAAQIEADKTRHASRIAEGESFAVPTIREYSSEQGVILFERLKGFEQIKFHNKTERDQLMLVNRLGTILAMIHDSDLPYPDNPVYIDELKGHSVSREKAVFIHGDFSFVNIFHCESSDTIAIIDWSVGGWIADPATHGPAYLDLGLLVIDIFWSRPFARRCANPELVASRFIDSYLTTISFEFSNFEFVKTFEQLVDSYYRDVATKTKGVTSLAYYPSLRRSLKFVKGIL